MDKFTIYVLKCKNDKYYVGKTEKNINDRFLEHQSGKGSEWTNKYEPLQIIEFFKNSDSYDEDTTTKKYMQIYGIENVRGGSYSQINLPTYKIKALNDEFNSSTNACYRCGRKGHFVDNCYAGTHVNGNILTKKPGTNLFSDNVKTTVLNTLNVIEESMHTGVSFINKTVDSLTEHAPALVGGNITKEQNTEKSIVQFKTSIYHHPVGTLDDDNMLLLINDIVISHLKNMVSLDDTLTYEFKYKYFTNEKYKDQTQKCIILTTSENVVTIKGCNFVCSRNGLNRIDIYKIPAAECIKHLHSIGISFENYVPIIYLYPDEASGMLALFLTQKSSKFNNPIFVDDKTLHLDAVNHSLMFNDEFNKCSINKI